MDSRSLAIGSLVLNEDETQMHTLAMKLPCTRTFFIHTILVVMIGISTLAANGCARWNKVDMTERMDELPAMMLDSSDEFHMLTMQAPNPGWSILIDKDELSPVGMRVFVTVRRPDPSFMYPQVIVEKRLKSDVMTDTGIEIYARLLDFDEKSSGRGYVEISPVSQFED